MPHCLLVAPARKGWCCNLLGPMSGYLGKSGLLVQSGLTVSGNANPQFFRHPLVGGLDWRFGFASQPDSCGGYMGFCPDHQTANWREAESCRGSLAKHVFVYLQILRDRCHPQLDAQTHGAAERKCARASTSSSNTRQKAPCPRSIRGKTRVRSSRWPFHPGMGQN